MLYIRGNRRDYDNWVRMGAYGWSWEEVFPYFLKSEDNRDPSIAYNGKRAFCIALRLRVAECCMLLCGSEKSATR